MVIKLTYYNSQKPILIPIKKIKYVSQAYDSRLKRFSTKLVFKSKTKNGKKVEEYINVNEDLKTIYEIINDVTKGFTQKINWDEISFNDALENSFNIDF